MSTIEDPRADWTGSATGDYLDIIFVRVSEIDEDNLRFTLQMAGPIPQVPSHHLGYVWHLDLDKDGLFNNSAEDLNVRVAYDPNSGWNGYVDRHPSAPTLAGC